MSQLFIHFNTKKANQQPINRKETDSKISATRRLLNIPQKSKAKGKIMLPHISVAPDDMGKDI